MTTAPAAPVAVARTTANPCPRVEVTITPAGDNATITLWRTDPTGSSIVRGGDRVPVSGPVLVVDYEAPFGVAVTYAAIGYSAAGEASPSSPSSAPVTLAVTGCPWVQDPTDPGTAMVWQLAEWPQRTHGRDDETLWPVTSDVAVVLTGPRRQPTSTMTVLTRAAAQAAALLLLTDLPVILVRTDAAWRWRGGYFATGEVVENPHVVGVPTDQDRFWQVPLTPVAPAPAGGVVAYNSWADVVDLYPTWAAVVATKPSWLELVRNPDPGG